MNKDCEIVSVIVPVYNVEKYLRRCVDSILNQTYQNIEIILVDDGSPDNCGAICDDYQNTDYRVKVIHKKNGGLSDARNVAISQTSGEYITFVDSDDWVSPYYVEHLYKAVSMWQADLGSSWFENVFDKQVPQSKSEMELVKCECLTSKECLKKLLYQDGVETSAWGKIYKRELFKQLRYPVGKLYEDIPVTYQAIKMSNRIAVISNIDYYYFQRTDSIQYQQFNLNKLDGVFHCRQLMESVKWDYPELSSAAECRYFSTVCNILFQIHATEFEQQKNELWSEVKKYRKNVLLDNAGRKKARLAALLSFGGYNLLSKVYKKTQGRG